jgi:hypothetical protein
MLGNLPETGGCPHFPPQKPAEYSNSDRLAWSTNGSCPAFCKADLILPDLARAIHLQGKQLQQLS